MCSVKVISKQTQENLKQVEHIKAKLKTKDKVQTPGKLPNYLKNMKV